MLTSRAIFIFSVVISRTIAKLSVTSIRRSDSIPIMPWLTPSVPKPGRFIGDLTGQHEPAWSNARSDAEKAVAIAPDLAEAHAALGWVRFFIDWKFAEGLTAIKRAKELSPANPTANDLLARAILYLGRLDEAERQARHAVELDPLSAIAQGNLARALFFAGKLDEADAAARKAAELQPASASSRRWQTLIAAQRGDGETALREAQLEPDEGYRRFELALAQYRARRSRSGRRVAGRSHRQRSG